MKTTKEQRTTMPPGRTLEAEENSLISLATDLARSTFTDLSPEYYESLDVGGAA